MTAKEMGRETSEIGSSYKGPGNLVLPIWRLSTMFLSIFYFISRPFQSSGSALKVYEVQELSHASAALEGQEVGCWVSIQLLIKYFREQWVSDSSPNSSSKFPCVPGLVSAAIPTSFSISAKWGAWTQGMGELSVVFFAWRGWVDQTLTQKRESRGSPHAQVTRRSGWAPKETM